MNAEINLIIGPMFSGKTTSLMQLLTIYATSHLNVVYVNSTLDTRASIFSTHNQSLKMNKQIEMIKTVKLMDIYNVLKKFDVIAIDEGHFFSDLFHVCMCLCEIDKKNVIVASLNGNSDRELFGDVNKLIPVCDNITFMSSICSMCAEDGKITRAIFSLKLDENDSDKIKIGGSDMYKPVCRNHHT